MGFGAPWFLAGALAVGLPLWLHLLRQFKRTPQPFSSLMFFERRVQTSSRHRRLRYLVLLALRLCLLVLLALAFANPFVSRPATSAKRRSLTVIALDRSFSMRYGNRFSLGKAAAKQLIDNAGSNNAEVLAFDGRVENLAPPGSDKHNLASAVDGLQPSDAASSYGELSRALRVMEASMGVQLKVHIISDMQQTSMPGAFADLQVGPHTELTLHSVAERKAPNWAVESVTAPEHVARTQAVKVSASIAGWTTSATQRSATLLLDGRVVETKNVVIPDCGRAEVEWSNFDVPYGIHRGEVRLEPHDSLPQDDTFAFSMERSDPKTVLFVYRDGRPQESFYYRSAVAASPQAGLEVKPVSVSMLPSENLTKIGFVVLNDPGTLDTDLEQKLCDYVAHGGAVLIGAGIASQRAGRIPVGAETVNGSSASQGPAQQGHEDDVALDLGSTTLANVQFLRPSVLVPKPDDRVVSRLEGGSPLLLEAHRGEGRILVFAASLDNDSTDFPLHASFLPFVAKSGAFLTGMTENPSSVVVGSPITLRRSGAQKAAADVLGPDGTHRLQLADTTRAMFYDVEEAGFYDVQRADGVRSLVAVHADRRESDLTPISTETLSLWSHLGKGANPADPSSGQWKGEPVRTSFWRILLFLVLLTALAETVFASRYLARKEDGRL